jgi:DNA-binding Lrp family transcriptional regulator
MNVLLAQYWDVNREKEDEYRKFIGETYIPSVSELGLKVVGGYYVEVGPGPSTVGVLSADDLGRVNEIVVSEPFRKLTNELNFYVRNRRAALGYSTGRISREPYTIQKGVWKWNHYYNVKPHQKEEYKKFLGQMREVFAKLDFVDLTEEWHVLYGGVSDYIMEMTFQDPIDISRLMNNHHFRNLEKLVKQKMIENYSSRIMRSTERFDKPRWITL